MAARIAGSCTAFHMVPFGNTFEVSPASFSAPPASPQIASARAGRRKRRAVSQLPENASARASASSNSEAVSRNPRRRAVSAARSEQSVRLTAAALDIPIGRLQAQTEVFSRLA
jgi:hypothetical protein